MIFLRTIERPSDVEDGSAMGFDLPAVRGLRRLEIRAPVTFFVGENGSGKSTLLEAIGLRAKMRCAAGTPLEHDPALVPIHPLARALRLQWMPQTKYGFFLRVEDYFMQAREHRRRTQPLASVSVSVDPESKARRLYTPAADPREDMDSSRPSPGESFLDFLSSHCEPGGLHLIDEPEAVLSPQRQLTFMGLVKSVVAENSQFIIATHSPILLAYPDAQIVCFDGDELRNVTYNELSHVAFTRDFLNNPDKFLRALPDRPRSQRPHNTL
jgi:predicted ATPase